jgi:hypothetical protein
LARKQEPALFDTVGTLASVGTFALVGTLASVGIVDTARRKASHTAVVCGTAP